MNRVDLRLIHILQKSLYSNLCFLAWNKLLQVHHLPATEEEGPVGHPWSWPDLEYEQSRCLKLSTSLFFYSFYRSYGIRNRDSGFRICHNSSSYWQQKEKGLLDILEARSFQLLYLTAASTEAPGFEYVTTVPATPLTGNRRRRPVGKFWYCLDMED